MSYTTERGEQALELIRHRRTVKPEQFDGTDIPAEIVNKILEAANWAPTHGHTEPWRFFVLSGDSMTEFGDRILEAMSEKSGVPIPEVKADKLRHRLQLTSHLVVIAMKRGDNPKIPAEEEVMATACSVQNLWIAASAFGVAGYWNSGGLTYEDQLKEDFGLRPEDRLLGFFYLGNTKEPWPVGRRQRSVESKTNFIG